MDKLAYALAIVASAALMIAGNYLDAVALRFIGAFAFGAFGFRLVSR